MNAISYNITLDKPYKSKSNRDGYMAGSIKKILDDNPHARFLVVFGNPHILKKVLWEEHVKTPHGFIRSYLDNSYQNIRWFQ